MNTRTFLRAIVAVAAALCVSAIPALAQGQAPQRVDVLIGFTSPPTPDDVGIVRAIGGQVRHVYSIVPAMAASVPEPALNGLARDGRVRYVEEDGPVYTTAQAVPWGIERVFGDVPNDRELSWQRADGGRAVRVAIFDTGIALHPDLEVAGGVSFVGGSYQDVHGHGTHVAGTVAALDNELGVVGVAPRVDLYAVKVLSDGGSGQMSDVIAALQWAADPNNGYGVMDVVNMSLSGGGSQTLENAVNAVYNGGQGVLLIASAGNDGSHPRFTRVGYPARYASVMAVAATTQSNTRASFSSTGPEVEIAAPGVEILSTVPGDGYASYNGTSMAAPHVAGVAALLIGANPDLSAGDVRQILRSTALNLGSANEFGYGLVQATPAVYEAWSTYDWQVPAAPKGLAAVSGDGTVYLTWNPSEWASSYNVERSETESGNDFVGIAAGLTTTSFLDTGLINDKPYWYRVTAENPAGVSDPSEPPVEATPKDASDPPGPPRDLAVVAVSKSMIALSWNYDDWESHTGFKIHRTWGETDDEVILVGPDERTYLDTGLSSATQYGYEVWAYNTAGKSASSVVGSATTFPEPSVTLSGSADTLTRGNWIGAYGSWGYHLSRQDAVSQPNPYVLGLGGNVALREAAATIWTSPDPKNDVRAFQRPPDVTETDRFAHVYYHSGSFYVDISLFEPALVSMYFVDWDTTQRRQTITFTDAVDSTSQLAAESLGSSFNGGLYLSWVVAGQVTIEIKRTGQHNAVLSGIFFDPVPASQPNQPPIADFGYAMDGLTVTFTDQSTDPDGSVEAWAWTFGDGATSNEQHPVHSYAAGGTYTVTLTVTDNVGAIGSVSKSLAVTAPGGPDQVMESSLAGTGARINPNFWRATVTVTITSNGAGVEGADVQGSWSGGVTGTVSGQTDPNGVISFTSANIRNNVGSVNFQITAVTKAGYTWSGNDATTTVHRP
jgi:subtilisin